MAAGWNIRLMTLGGTGRTEIERFFLVFEADKEKAVALLKRSPDFSEGERIEVVAEVAANEFIGRRMKPGEIQQHV